MLASRVDRKSILLYSTEIVYRSRSGIGLFVGLYVDLITELVLFVGIELDGSNHFGNLSTISFRGEDHIFIYSNLLSLIVFRIALLDLLKEMAGNSQFMVKIVNNHPSKIDVVKFDDMNNFGM